MDNEPWLSESWWTRERPITKVLRMYLEEQYKDTNVIVFAKVGKFYEIFGPNVGIVEQLLQLNPSVRTSLGYGIPNNGIPYTRFPAAMRILKENGREARVIYPVGNTPNIKSKV